MKKLAFIVISLVLTLMLPTSSANASANYKLGSKFSLYLMFIFTDQTDASTNCLSITGKWSSLTKKTVTVTNQSGKILAKSKKSFSLGTGYLAYNTVVESVSDNRSGGPKTLLNANQCMWGISINNIDSDQSSFIATVPGIGKYKYTHKQIQDSIVNNQSSFEVFLR